MYGSVICQNLSQAFAPSRSTTSYKMSGTLCNAARNINISTLLDHIILPICVVSAPPNNRDMNPYTLHELAENTYATNVFREQV